MKVEGFLLDITASSKILITNVLLSLYGTEALLVNRCIKQ